MGSVLNRDGLGLSRNGFGKDAPPAIVHTCICMRPQVSAQYATLGKVRDPDMYSDRRMAPTV